MAGNDKLTTFSVHRCPMDLAGRVKAKAALVGQDKDEWVIRLFERETKELKGVQQKFQKEEQERAAQDVIDGPKRGEKKTGGD